MRLPAFLPAVSGLLIALAAAAVPAAGSRAAEPPSGAPSLEVLVLRAVAALNGRDTAGLARLAAGKEEFLAAYPHFSPDTSAERRSFASGYFLEDNRKLLRRVVEQGGGRDLALARFTVTGQVEPLGAAVLHRGLRIWVVSGDAEIELRLATSVLRTGGTWKIWGFSDD